ncbi:S8 family peptidase [Candidatus Reidiella endopervernicosa]|uniref:S8 family serine peptidase n=1 Tax=Candidatus Reidiella endopervernicosa TaxID=2738883 RepID=A0A6N0I0J1_9GAMM|nr:S8 family peptidase [Candidatus Reidiella endopervernicosa]QKQ27996.1 S8 family serine peptidase [Candidatus Reidiella endopervernicosa]
MKTVTRIVLPVLLCTLTTSATAGGKYQDARRLLLGDHTDRLIVKLRPESDGKRRALNSDRISRLAVRAGNTIKHHRRMSGRSEVIRLPRHLSIYDVRMIAQRIQFDPEVEYVEPDYIRFPMAEPDDTRYDDQWPLHDVIDDSEPGSANLEKAWDITTGSASVITAVIDTGLLPHTDIVADGNINDDDDRVLPGYDFVDEDGAGDYTTANDGDARDADPTDPGDWVSNAESIDGGSVLFGCDVESSSWHGTHVAGTIAADSDNSKGVAGVDWTGKLLPIRVLGKCGGYTSDIIDGMSWAAGISVPGVSDNPNPAKVINLSLGGSGSCSTSEQNTVDAVTAAGTVIVAAAGNDSGNVSNSAPANCDGVVAVAAVDRTGGLASYSNFGALVDISAPGSSVLHARHRNTTLDNSDTYAYYSGTSMATPHVSGVAALMLAVDATLTPTEIEQKLKDSARIFPTGTGDDCTTSTCGAGILNAYAAVGCARPATDPTADAGSDTAGDPTDEIQLSGSVADDCVTAFSWSQTAGTTATITGSTTATPTVTIPNSSGSLTFELTVTDDESRTDTDTVIININNVSTPTLFTIENQTIVVGDTNTLTITATDSDGSDPIMTAATLPTGATFGDNDDGTADFSWAPTSGQIGDHDITFTATDRNDSGSSDSQTVTFSVVGDVAPTLNTIDDQSVMEGEQLSFSISGTDTDGTDPLLTATGLPSGATLLDNDEGTAYFLWTPSPSQTGDHSITFIATDRNDSGLTDSQTITISVEAEVAPVLASIDNQTVIEGETLSFSISATDSDGSDPLLTATSLPSTATLTDNGDGTADFSWSPTFSLVGIHRITFIATDSGNSSYSDSQQVTITVEASPDRSTVSGGGSSSGGGSLSLSALLALLCLRLFRR